MSSANDCVFVKSVRFSNNYNIRCFLWRLKTDAVSEVKRQAVAELHKAVSAAESKASELVAVERAKMDRMLVDVEARRQAAEEALSAINRQEDNTEVLACS